MNRVPSIQDSPNGPTNPAMKTLHPRTIRGFTLIEMIVAVSVMSLMLALAARIFYDAQKVVSRGRQTSQIIAEARALSQPFLDDARKMYVYEAPLGGNTPGCLVIVQQLADGVRFPNTQGPVLSQDKWLDEFADDADDAKFRAADPTMYRENIDADSKLEIRMRTDQIAFFRNAKGLESLTSGTDKQYDSLAKARTARVWYGHVWPDEAGAPSSGATNDRPGDAKYDVASQLTLGRQALLLVDNTSQTTYPNGDSGSLGTASGPLNRIATFGTSVASSLSDGRHDVFDLNTYNVSGNTYSSYDDSGTGSAPQPSLFRTPTFGSPAPAQPSLFGNAGGAAAGTLPNATYVAIARDWTFELPGSRLRAATTLPDDFTSGIFTADQVAKLHGAISTHVADFAIDFAADWEDNGDRTTNPANSSTPDNIWPDGEPDHNDDGSIRWYSAVLPNPDTDLDGLGDAAPALPVTSGIPGTVPMFSLGAVSATTSNPFHTTVGTREIFVWSHTGDNPDTNATSAPDTVEGSAPYWPYLIRIRYRLMDGKGELRTTHPVTGEPVVGRWFEQIIPVPRPQGLY